MSLIIKRVELDQEAEEQFEFEEELDSYIERGWHSPVPFYAEHLILIGIRAAERLLIWVFAKAYKIETLIARLRGKRLRPIRASAHDIGYLAIERIDDQGVTEIAGLSLEASTAVAGAGEHELESEIGNGVEHEETLTEPQFAEFVEKDGDSECA